HPRRAAGHHDSGAVDAGRGRTSARDRAGWSRGLLREGKRHAATDRPPAGPPRRPRRGRASRLVVQPRPRVLIADDHEAMATVLSRVLSRECDVVGVVGDGGEVVDAAARLQPAVIVVDVNLPHVNGLEVCRAITRANPLAKVLIMTAMVDDAIREEAMAA